MLTQRKMSTQNDNAKIAEQQEQESLAIAAGNFQKNSAGNFQKFPNLQPYHPVQPQSSLVSTNVTTSDWKVAGGTEQRICPSFRWAACKGTATPFVGRVDI